MKGRSKRVVAVLVAAGAAAVVSVATAADAAAASCVYDAGAKSIAVGHGCRRHDHPFLLGRLAARRRRAVSRRDDDEHRQHRDRRARGLERAARARPAQRPLQSWRDARVERPRDRDDGQPRRRGRHGRRLRHRVARRDVVGRERLRVLQRRRRRRGDHAARLQARGAPARRRRLLQRPRHRTEPAWRTRGRSSPPAATVRTTSARASRTTRSTRARATTTSRATSAAT